MTTSPDSRHPPEFIETVSRLGETILVVTACAAPWMFGAVEAWSVWLLEIGVGAVAVVAALMGRDAVVAQSGGMAELGAGGVGIAGVAASRRCRWECSGS